MLSILKKNQPTKTASHCTILRSYLKGILETYCAVNVFRRVEEGRGKYACFQILAWINPDYLSCSRSHLELDLVILTDRAECSRRNSMIPNCSWGHLDFFFSLSPWGLICGPRWFLWKCTSLKARSFYLWEFLLGSHNQSCIAQGKIRPCFR